MAQNLEYAPVRRDAHAEVEKINGWLHTRAASGKKTHPPLKISQSRFQLQDFPRGHLIS
jgi:hypothetical protein